MSVQLIGYPKSRTVTLEFIRQVVEVEEDDWLAPVGGVVMSFTYESPNPEGTGHEFWSFEHRSLERFVDAVEQTPEIADRLVRRPVKSSVQWEDA